jgi:LDH2 family malate/lactate/ureidoglycolate dehydrogenase
VVGGKLNKEERVMPRFKAEDLQRLTEEIFRREGAPEEAVKILAGHLIRANLAGMDSHGVIRIPHYIELMRSGTVNGKPFYRIQPEGRHEIVRDDGSTVLVNGNWCFGQVTAWKSINLAVERAKQHGISCVCSYNTAHIGRLGEYTGFAAEQDMVAMVFCSIGRIVAPFGGIERKLGTNPISIGIPTNGDSTFVLDFATSTQAEGKIRNYLMSDKKVQLGWIIDRSGNQTREPKDLYNGGALLPIGGKDLGYKGYGLSLMVEILGAMMTRSGFPGYPGHQYGSSGTVMIAIDIERFVDIDVFKEGVGQLIEDIKKSKKCSGFDEILIPGEPEFRSRQMKSREGVELPEKVLDSIKEVACSLDIRMDEYLKEID